MAQINFQLTALNREIELIHYVFMAFGFNFLHIALNDFNIDNSLVRN